MGGRTHPASAGVCACGRSTSLAHPASTPPSRATACRFRSRIGEPVEGTFESGLEWMAKIRGRLHYVSNQGKWQCRGLSDRKLPRLLAPADCFFPANMVSILPVVAIVCLSARRRCRKQVWMHNTAYRDRTTRLETVPGENRVSSGIVVSGQCRTGPAFSRFGVSQRPAACRRRRSEGSSRRRRAADHASTVHQ